MRSLFYPLDLYWWMAEMKWYCEFCRGKLPSSLESLDMKLEGMSLVFIFPIFILLAWLLILIDIT